MRQPALARVLLATDFSTDAQLAARRVALLPLARDAVVELLHVLSPVLPHGDAQPLETVARARLGRAAAVLRRAARTFGRSRLRVKAAVSYGEPFVEIIRRSRVTDAELIVLGRRGRTALRHLPIGSTSRRVVQKGDVPVLVVSGVPAQPYRHPLLATDLDDASVRTFALAQRILEPQVRSVNVVHAFNVPFEGFVTPLSSAARESEFRRSFQTHAVSALQEFLASHAQSGIAWNPCVKAGEPRAVILREVMRGNTDLLIIGTHARSGLVHALLGSVADWAIASVPCDVLIARPVRFSFELP